VKCVMKSMVKTVVDFVAKTWKKMVITVLTVVVRQIIPKVCKIMGRILELMWNLSYIIIK